MFSLLPNQARKTYDMPYRNPYFFVTIYWTKSDRVFADMQIMSYIFIILKHIQINSQFRKILMLKVRLSFLGQSVWMLPFHRHIRLTLVYKKTFHTGLGWFHCAVRIVDEHYFDSPKCTNVYQDAFIKCLISWWNVGYWQSIIIPLKLCIRHYKQPHHLKEQKLYNSISAYDKSLRGKLLSLLSIHTLWSHTGVCKQLLLNLCIRHYKHPHHLKEQKLYNNISAYGKSFTGK